MCSDTIDGVVVDRVQSENVLQLGPQLVALRAWESLGLPRLLAETGLNPGQIATAQPLVTTALPLQDGRVLRIRKPSQPDPEQALLYHKLRIDWKSAFPALKFFLTVPVLFCSSARRRRRGGGP